jgi:hypothetical protein
MSTRREKLVLDRSGWRLLVIRDIARSPFKPPALIVLGRLFHDPNCGLRKVHVPEVENHDGVKSARYALPDRLSRVVMDPAVACGA